eukprot:TRINITY_DN32544_c0_g1_i1.p1 TRINITY_DN32544_c0_g1~~TRINITY_DN32544_c0_g1_i1.p1  ORF type:complete len:399 (-),score=84.16 TRINITY_DN32544_c0_g1_i1:278-1390(-)
MAAAADAEMPWRAEMAGKVETRYCADTCAFGRLPYLEDLVACGTYTLEESTGQRHGDLLLLRACPSASENERLVQVPGPAAGELSGVYQVAWSPVAPALAAALADGSVGVWRLPEGADGSEVESAGSWTQQLQELTSCILTYVAWSCSGSRLLLPSQDGDLYCVDASGTALATLQSWHAHDAETWSCAWDPNDASEQICLSGADDSMLKLWDLRSGSNPSAVNKKSHEAGVTDITFAPTRPQLFATGSYDEKLRLFDRRNLSRPLLVSSRLGDGAYRVAFHPSEDVVAIAAMRAAFQLHAFDVRSAETDGEVLEAGDLRQVGSYGSETEGCHGSLAYGISWHRSGQFLASASFYDRSLHVWRATAGAAAK